MLTRLSPTSAVVTLVLLIISLPTPAPAVEVTDLYEATVPLEQDTQAQRAAAFREAMQAVLVRVVGNTELASGPETSDLIRQSEAYVQQFRRTREGDFWVRFDGQAINKALTELGLQIWGSERPSVLLLLAVDRGGGERYILSAEDELPDPDNDALREQLQTEAETRGLPMVFPLMDAQDRDVLSFNEVWGGFDQSLSSVGLRYDADAILLGRYSLDAVRDVRWTLYEADQAYRWEGVLESGIPGAADEFALRYAVATGAALEGEIGVAIAGIESLQDYGRTLRYLEGLTAIETVSVRRIEGDKAVFGLRLRGNLENVDQAIRLGGVLKPDLDGTTGSEGGPGGADDTQRRVALAYRLAR